MKALLVDDEKLARERLSRLLQAFSEIEIVGEASNGEEALQILSEREVDVVFLDIEMPGLNGLDTALHIGPKGPAVIFVTAYDEFALKAFEVHAIDYLVKPTTKERLAISMQKLNKTWHGALQELMKQLPEKRKRHCAVRVGKRFVVVPLDQIAAICAQDHYSEIIYQQERLLSDDPLDKLMERLDSNRFIRIHRKAIINIAFLQELVRQGDRKYIAVLSDYFRTELPVSRESLDKLKKHLSL